MKAPICSMTGFAHVKSETARGRLLVEIKSVNYRYLDISLRLGDMLRSLEPRCRDYIRERVQRGKVELNVFFEPTAKAAAFKLNEPHIKELIKACQTIETWSGRPAQLDPVALLHWPEAVVMSHPIFADNTENEKIFFELLEKTLSVFNQSRAAEGKRLSDIILAKLKKLGECVESLSDMQAPALLQHKEKLLARLKAVDVQVEPNRLEQELVFWAERADIAEELERLRSHRVAAEQAISEGGALGRRLDFLMQEFLRETSTLSAKVNHVKMSEIALEMKILVEQMREQVQNFE